MLKSSLPAKLYPERATTDLLDSFTRTLEYSGTERTLARLPLPAERERLHDRSVELARILRPANLAQAEQETAGRAVAQLFGQYTNMKDRLENAAGIADTMVKKFPVWAIVQACADVYDNKVYDEDRKTGARKYLSPDFPVTGIRLAQVAESHCGLLRDEQTKLLQVLSCAKARPALPDFGRRLPPATMPLMSEAHRAAEEHYNTQRTQRLDEMGKRAKEQREQTVLRLYKARGIAPQRGEDGNLIHPDIAAMKKVPVAAEQPEQDDD